MRATSQDGVVWGRTYADGTAAARSLRLYAAICLPHRISSVLEPGKSLDPSLALNADESSLDHLALA